jgi:hypothetical protein
MASVLETIQEIYPEKFFNISQPDAPIVQIQVRTNVSGNINNNEDWTEVHLEPGMTNYFNTMNVEDSGGLQKVTITFFDKNFANVENAIVKSLVVTKLHNDLAGNEPVQDDTGYFSFKIDNQVATNIRIRFGYSEIPQGQDFIDETDFKGEGFSGRVNSDKTIIRSPWIYLQMIGTKFNLREEGLYAEITAFSVVDSFLNRAKLIRRFAVLRGKPSEILTSLCNIIKNTAESNSFDYNIGDAAEIDALVTEDTSGEIEINLGSEPDETRRGYRTMYSIFSEVISKIPSRKYGTVDTSAGVQTNGETEAAEQVSKDIPYNYVVRQEVGAGKLKTIMDFKYLDPVKEPQSIIRTYIWKEYGQSIVRNLSLESQVDFASLNAQILTEFPDGQGASLSVARTSSSDGTPNSESSTHLGRITDVTKALAADDNYSFAFVSNTVNDDSDGQKTFGARVASEVVHNLNQGVFKGTIEIPGDPFYLFDNKMSPYQFLIKIIVLRPGYLDDNNNYQGNSVSYLSGIYNVSKINHTIDASGFRTTLEVIRWPIEG